MADKATWKKYYRARAEWFKGANTTNILDYDSSGLSPKRPEGSPPRRKRRKKRKQRKAKAK